MKYFSDLSHIKTYEGNLIINVMTLLWIENIMLREWQLQSIKRVLLTHPFNILEKQYLKPDQKSPFTAYVLECPRWANVIALNAQQEILLERQYRFGTEQIEIEIPGGVIKVNELPLEGAQRELEEETGFISSNWQQIGVVAQNPAIMNSHCYTFVAHDIRSTGQTHFDIDEDIEFFFASRKEVNSMIRAGQISNAYIIAAFYWLINSESKE
jgi:ADP-ribose pyrophosphatase